MDLFENTRFVLGHYIKYLKFGHFRKMLLINVAQNMGFPLRNGLRMTFLGQNVFLDFQKSVYSHIKTQNLILTKNTHFETIS